MTVEVFNDDFDLDVVRYTLDHFLKSDGAHGHTDLVQWHCERCRTGGDASDIHRAVTGLSAHLYRHHHAGAGVLP